MAEADAEAGHGVGDGAGEGEGLVQVMVVVLGGIIQLDLLHQKGARHPGPVLSMGSATQHTHGAGSRDTHTTANDTRRNTKKTKIYTKLSGWKQTPR